MTDLPLLMSNLFDVIPHSPHCLCGYLISFALASHKNTYARPPAFSSTYYYYYYHHHHHHYSPRRTFAVYHMYIRIRQEALAWDFKPFSAASAQKAAKQS
jgi:hypothetical protein